MFASRARHRSVRVIASLLLSVGIALLWMSLTPSGSVRCAHCFLYQQWVDVIVIGLHQRQSRPDARSGLSPRVFHAAMTDSDQPLELSLTGEPSGMAPYASSLSGVSSMMICRSPVLSPVLSIALAFDPSPSWPVIGLVHWILGFRAPPSLLAA